MYFAELKEIFKSLDLMIFSKPASKPMLTKLPWHMDRKTLRLRFGTDFDVITRLLFQMGVSWRLVLTASILPSAQGVTVEQLF